MGCDITYLSIDFNEALSGYKLNRLKFLLGVPPDQITHLTGIYDLVAVLTHKGRSADSGHYVAWVKQENGKFQSNTLLALFFATTHDLLTDKLIV